MNWFEHRHRWLAATGLSTIKCNETNVASGALYLQECFCGAVRQIEFRAGEAPKVFLAEHVPTVGDRTEPSTARKVT